MKIETSDKKTVGSSARELLLKPDLKQGIVDTQREVDKEYFREIEKCVTQNPHCTWTSPWYLIVLHKKERLLENVVRRYFLGRRSLPTPQYDQTVWRYYPSTGNLQFIWCIPDKEISHQFILDPLSHGSEYDDLRKFVLEFMDGTLYASTQKRFPE